MFQLWLINIKFDFSFIDNKQQQFNFKFKMKNKKQQSKTKIKSIIVKEEPAKPKKQSMKGDKVLLKSKDKTKKHQVQEGKKKETECRQKNKSSISKPEFIIQELERNMKELKQYYYQSIRSNRNSSRCSDKAEGQFRSCRQSFEVPESKKVSKEEEKGKNGRKQNKSNKNNSLKVMEKQSKKSLMDIYNFYKRSIDSSLSKFNQKKAITPHNSQSSKKNKNSSTKIHCTSVSLVSNNEENAFMQISNNVTPFELSRPASPLNTKNFIKEKVKKKSSKKEGIVDLVKREEQDQLKIQSIPQIHSSLYRKNMPIMEEDSKYEASSCLNDLTSKKQTEEIESLAGCSIPKIKDIEFDDFELVSIQL